MKEDFQKSRLWEKVAAGVLGLFAIRELRLTFQTIIAWVVILVLLGCGLLYFALN